MNALVSSSRLNVVSYGELASIEFPPNKWVVDFLIPASGITILSALPGSYKTWLLLHLAISIATGGKVFGEFETSQSNVLMIDEENGPRLIQGRLRDLGGYDDMPVSFLFDEGFTVTEKSIDTLIDYCKEHKIVFVTIDSLIRVHGSNENDAMEMSKVFGQLKKLTAAGISVLVTHHNRKPSGNSFGGSQEMRGSSDILAALDCHIAIKRDGRRLKLVQTKIRLCEEMSPIEVELIVDLGGRVSFEYIGTAKKHDTVSRSEEVTGHLESLLEEGHSYNQSQLQKQLRDRGVGVSINTLRKLLDDLVQTKTLNVEEGERNSLIYTLMEPTSSAVPDISNR
jgi:hypothetical protein